jgi:hypothetical protein
MALPIDLAEQLSPGTAQWLADHLDAVARRIVADARASNIRQDVPDPMMVVDAAKHYVPGGEISSPDEPRLRWWESLTMVAAALTLTFGLLGFILARSPTAGVAATAGGWLDIAKVFAGAIVGSAGSSVVTKTRSVSRDIRSTPPTSPKAPRASQPDTEQ